MRPEFRPKHLRSFGFFRVEDQQVPSKVPPAGTVFLTGKDESADLLSCWLADS
jgi:hypothetical protein